MLSSAPLTATSSPPSGVDHLGDHILVGVSHNQAVLGSVKLVLVLRTQSTSGLVIGLTVLSSLEFRLKSLEVSLVLLDLDQSVGSLLSSIPIFSGHFGSGIPNYL